MVSTFSAFHPAAFNTRTRRRNAVVVLWLSLIAYIAVAALTGFEGVVGAIAALLSIVVVVVILGLSRSVGLEKNEADLDERELAERNRNHVRAYRALVRAMAVPMIYGFFALQLGWWLPSTPHEVVNSFVAVISAVGLVPLSILAWSGNDPDPEDVDSTPARLGRFPVRAPGRRIFAALLSVSLALLAVRLMGSTLLPTVNAAELAGFATAFVLALLATRTEKTRQR